MKPEPQRLRPYRGDKYCDAGGAEAETRKTFVEIAKDFARRINWLKFGRMAVPVASGALLGAAMGGPLGSLVGAVHGLSQASNQHERDKEVAEVKKAYSELQPELKELLEKKREASLPKEIDALRSALEALLAKLDITLVVLVDDLDRCLPDTAISTLEAMRLLLHVRRTAFIIAADEQMIRGAVRAHFHEAGVDDNLVTSYFDKLIQVPLRVPRLGVNEVRTYVMLLLADLAARNGSLDVTTHADAQQKLLGALKTAWKGPVNRRVLTEAYGDKAAALATEIEIADQIAPLLVSAEQISGNPRLIKRFLNNLMIRRSIANSQGMSLSLDALVKMQLFERCASGAAFDFLATQVASNDEGKAPFLSLLEDAAAKGEPYKEPTQSWAGKPYEQWIRLSPQLGTISLSPFLYLSRDRTLAIAAYDELSQQGRVALEACLAATEPMASVQKLISALGRSEAESVLQRLIRKARADQWTFVSINRCFNITQAIPELGPAFAIALAEVPGQARSAALIPVLSRAAWADALLADWASDGATSGPTKTAIKNKAKN
jgi:predicted KAP-like P-loop ATPase